ncbi:MAG: PadR family transcriptional regulator [Gaiella sp.]|nr:PadR family transcriptional regulator [Gaiella sp.]
MTPPDLEGRFLHIDKDLVAASATPLVLAILADGESYGYAILKRVRALSGESSSGAMECSIRCSTASVGSDT